MKCDFFSNSLIQYSLIMKIQIRASTSGKHYVYYLTQIINRNKDEWCEAEIFGFSSRRLFLNQQVQIYFFFKPLIQEPTIQGLLKGLKDMKREKICSKQNPKTFKIL